MGTQRFQKLYRSLAIDGSTAGLGDVGLLKLPPSAHGPFGGGSDEASIRTDDRFFLEEEPAAEEEDPMSADLDALVPLVAKLVACENSYFS